MLYELSQKKWAFLFERFANKNAKIPSKNALLLTAKLYPHTHARSPFKISAARTSMQVKSEVVVVTRWLFILSTSGPPFYPVHTSYQPASWHHPACTSQPAPASRASCARHFFPCVVVFNRSPACWFMSYKSVYFGAQIRCFWLSIWSRFNSRK